MEIGLMGSDRIHMKQNHHHIRLSQILDPPLFIKNLLFVNYFANCISTLQAFKVREREPRNLSVGQICKLKKESKTRTSKKTTKSKKWIMPFLLFHLTIWAENCDSEMLSDE